MADTSGPAYPYRNHSGITVRDLIAIEVVARLAATHWTGAPAERECVHWAKMAYGIADAMLIERAG